MPRFHLRRGITLILIGAFVFVFENGQSLDLVPALAGALIVVASLAAEKFCSWHHTLMQAVTLTTLCLLIWCGAKFTADVLSQPYPLLSVMADLGVMWIAFQSAFITSTAFQDEFEEQSQ